MALKKISVALNTTFNADNDNSKPFNGYHGLEYFHLANTESTKINRACFQNCYRLKYVKFDNDVVLKGVNNGVFYNCWDLESVESDHKLEIGETGNNLTGMAHFFGCHNLTNIPELTYWNYRGTGVANYTCFKENFTLRKLDLKTTRTGSYAYGQYCINDIHNVKEFILPKEITAINAKAFAGVRFEHLYLPASTPPTLANTTDALQVIDTNAVIHIPEGSLESYEEATNWADFADYFEDDIPVEEGADND